MKNLEPDDVAQLAGEVPGEIVIHFRWASVGGIDPDLCHPFPVSAEADTGWEGLSKRVLFQNGTWCDWSAALRRLRQSGHHTPDGPISDTRAAACLVAANGKRVLPKLPGRWVLMDKAKTELFGDWDEFEGMSCSNLGFKHRVYRAKPKDETPERRWLDRSWSGRQYAAQQPRIKRAVPDDDQMDLF